VLGYPTRGPGNSCNFCVCYNKTEKALRYKPEGHGFDSRWCQWNFSLT